MKRKGSWIAERIDWEHRRQKKWEKKLAEDKKKAEECFGKQEKK